MLPRWMPADVVRNEPDREETEDVQQAPPYKPSHYAINAPSYTTHRHYMDVIFGGVAEWAQSNAHGELCTTRRLDNGWRPRAGCSPVWLEMSRVQRKTEEVQQAPLTNHLLRSGT